MMNINEKKILIIQTAFIGDVILTTPIIESLVKEFPGVKIDFLTIPKSKNLLESNTHINELILFDKRGKDRGIGGLIRIGRMLRKKHYDICITPHRSLRSAFLTWKTKASMRIGFNRTAWKRGFTHLEIYKSDNHEIDRNLSLLNSIGLIRKKNLPVIYTTNEDKEKVESLFTEVQDLKLGRPFAVAPGSVWPTKRWPENYFMQFCKLLEEKSIRVVLVGGPEDEALCNRITSECQHAVTLAGKLSLRETMYLLTQCSGILTNDSAPLHLGMAAKIKVFAIFGPTVPEFGFAPFGPNSLIIQNQEITCRPCAIHGGNTCPIKTFECMESLKPKKIALQVIKEII